MLKGHADKAFSAFPPDIGKPLENDGNDERVNFIE